MLRYGLSPDMCHFIMNHRAGRDPEYLALFLSLGSIVYQLFSSIDENKDRSMRCTASQLSQLLLPSTNYYLVPISTHVVSKAAKFFMLQNFHLCWSRGFIFERSILYMVANDPVDGGRHLVKGSRCACQFILLALLCMACSMIKHLNMILTSMIVCPHIVYTMV